MRGTLETGFKGKYEETNAGGYIAVVENVGMHLIKLLAVGGITF